MSSLLAPVLFAISTLRVAAESVDIRSSAAPLNRLTFEGNVINGDRAEQWVVLFCVDWYGPCEELRRGFLGMAHQQSAALNAGRLFTDAVRFAEVDCAVDKVLCNEQLVETYPTVIHYEMGERATEWSGEGGSYDKELRKLSKWIGKELDPSRVRTPPPSKATPLESPPATLQQPGDAARARLMPIVAALLAATAWFLGHGVELWQTAHSAWQHLARSRSSAKARVAAAGKPQRSAKTPPAAEEISDADRLASLLPKEWASGRGSIEL